MTDGEAHNHGTMISRPIEQEMKTSYIDYAMSVIVGRALPDVRDGLKPVHRRVLYAMNELGNTSDKPHKKSARVVGEVLGKYHPHGDTSVYDTVVRMAQDFSLRYMLVDGQGNFGSVDGDNAAAMRYTEVRLSKIANEMLEDIDKETVDYSDNFDATLKEPTVLPARLPNLLVNGSTGIAVGMATNMPPHNLGEVVDALKIQLTRPEATVQELLAVIPGPDFPTGGIIHGRAGIVQAYLEGRGIVKVRAKADTEEEKGHERIIVTEIPYMVNKANLITAIADLVKEKKLEGIRDLRDESDRDGMRIVIELKRDAVADVVLNNLYKHTAMESSFGIMNLALVDGKPEILPLKGLLQAYLDHRVVIITRRTVYLLRKAQERLHIVKGLLLAVGSRANLDRIVAIIRESADTDDAKARLVAADFADVGISYVGLRLDEEQAKAILDLRLSKLTGLEVRKLKEEGEELVAKIADHQDILARPERVQAIIDTELTDIKDRFADKRRTQIVDDGGDLEVEDLIPDEHVVVTITNDGYIKRIPIDQYRLQSRGGKGLIGIKTKEEDFVVDTFVTTTHRYVLFFTNKGRVHWLKAHRIPEGERQAKGKAIVNLLEGLEDAESVAAAVPVDQFVADRFLFFATKNGLVKKTELTEYARPRAGGIIALGIEENDELVGAAVTAGNDDVMLVKNLGKAVRFHEDAVRPMGRPAYGVKGVECRSGEKVVSMVVIRDPEAQLLTVTAKGKGKRTPLTEFTPKSRGIWGVYCHEVAFDTGEVVGALDVKPDDQLLLSTKDGIVIRLVSSDIRLVGSGQSKGVILQTLEEDDAIVSVAKLSRSDVQASIDEAAAKLAKLEAPRPKPDLPWPDPGEPGPAGPGEEPDEEE